MYKPGFAFLVCVSLVGLATSTFCTGCGGGSGSGQDLAAQRSRLLLAEEPAGVLPVLAARETLAQDAEVVVVGRIGGIANPWDANRASFTMTDPSVDAAHGDHECTADCAFCKHKPSGVIDSLAVVEFVDEQGQVLPYGARELFELEADQMVVVRGRATVNSLGYLVLAANGIYVRR